MSGGCLLNRVCRKPSRRARRRENVEAYGLSRRVFHVFKVLSVWNVLNLTLNGMWKGSAVLCTAASMGAIYCCRVRSIKAIDDLWNSKNRTSTVKVVNNCREVGSYTHRMCMKKRLSNIFNAYEFWFEIFVDLMKKAQVPQIRSR